MSNESSREQSEKILQLVLNAIQQDGELREKYQVGEKFRFIRDRLNALRSRIEETVCSLQEVQKKAIFLADDEVEIYIHIFNAQGIVFQTWQKMISSSVFYEYSINRPIYSEKLSAESFIRSRPNKIQHGYLRVAIKKQDILSLPGPGTTKDAEGNPLIKIREGSLLFDRFISFVHNNHEFILNKDGHLVKKQD
jgi:hypothetical protein